MIKTTLIGHLGADATVKEVSGYSVISFNVAHSERRKQQDGTVAEQTTWVSCALWRKPEQAGIAQYLKKGTQIYVDGTPSVRTYINKQGVTQAVMEVKVNDIQLLGGGGTQQAAQPQQQYQQQKPQGYAQPTNYQPQNQTQKMYGAPQQQPQYQQAMPNNDPPDDLPF